MSTSNETIEVARKHLAVAYKNGGHPEKTATFYSDWSKDDGYDQHLNPDLYRGPKIAAQAVADFFPSSKPADIRILDVAAGTGFVAEHFYYFKKAFFHLQLRDLGFKHIDALDPSEGMLEKARQKRLYDHFICTYLDSNKKLPILEDTYDCAVTSGGMGEGHIPYNSLDQLIRVVKPGGLVCIVMREEYLNHSQYKDLLEPHMSRLEKEGYWQLVSRTVEEEYCFDLSGLVYNFKVLPRQIKKE
ncbi:methyltransferase-like protein 27 [Aplysia californica]|uniref:Methyltransferase-like protein 27 n=1 Tax=Aplysia californica TaxID=6500 RepID=A0ABM1W5D1_APLCA|nr:methyltransferase-like protein 27 [Aplysia californica]